MSDQVLRDALRMACRELTVRRHRWWSLFPYLDQAPEADVDDVVAEFIAKARGFPPEGSEGVSPCAELVSLKDALEFYADPSTYQESIDPHPTHFATGRVPIADDNYGAAAREALGRQA